MSGPLTDLPFPFRSEVDRHLALRGPPAIFTLDARGQLNYDASRTRESWDRLEGSFDVHSIAPFAFLFRDIPTGWVQFVFSTSVDLCRDHPRAEVRVFTDPQVALDTLHSLGSPPIVDDSADWSVLPGEAI